MIPFPCLHQLTADQPILGQDKYVAANQLFLSPCLRRLAGANRGSTASAGRGLKSGNRAKSNRHSSGLNLRATALERLPRPTEPPRRKRHSLSQDTWKSQICEKLAKQNDSIPLPASAHSRPANFRTRQICRGKSIVSLPLFAQARRSQ